MPPDSYSLMFVSLLEMLNTKVWQSRDCHMMFTEHRKNTFITLYMEDKKMREAKI